MEVSVAEVLHYFFNENKSVLSALIPEEFKQKMNLSSKQSPEASTSTSEANINNNDNIFQVKIDLTQFKHKDVSVITSKNVIIVEAKRNKEDGFGTEEHQFLRRIMVPKEYDIDNVSSKLSLDGILILTAPKLNQNKEECRVIPITRTFHFEKTENNKKKTK